MPQKLSQLKVILKTQKQKKPLYVIPNFEQAIIPFDKAVKIDPKNGFNYLNKSQ